MIEVEDNSKTFGWWSGIKKPFSSRKNIQEQATILQKVQRLDSISLINPICLSKS